MAASVESAGASLFAALEVAPVALPAPAPAPVSSPLSASLSDEVEVRVEVLVDSDAGSLVVGAAVLDPEGRMPPAGTVVLPMVDTMVEDPEMMVVTIADVVAPVPEPCESCMSNWNSDIKRRDSQTYGIVTALGVGLRSTIRRLRTQSRS